MTRKNFSLVELLIVMAIIIMLAAIVSGASVYVRRSARMRQTQAMLKGIEAALIEYEAEYGYYPKQTTAGGLKKSVLSSFVYPNGNKMIDLTESLYAAGGDDIVDTYGNAIFYLSPGKMNGKRFDLWSMGADGKHGADGSSVSDAQISSEDTDDINNWTRK